MKMKYFFPLVIAAIALVTACTSEDDATYLSELRVSSSYVALPQSGGSVTIDVCANEEWELDTVGTVVKGVKWLDFSTMSGTSGESQLKITAPASSSARNTVFKIVTKSGAVQMMNVLQGIAEVTPATCADIIAGPDSKTYRVTGVCTGIANETYGNWYLNDGTGEIYIYGTLDSKGAEKNFISWGLEVGDVITVEGPKTTYGSTIELVNVTVVNIKKSLIKVESTEVNGENSNELPVEGGEIKANIICKGQGVSVDIPEDAKSWLSISSINQKGSNAEVVFKAANNEGGDRGTTVTFRTTDGDKEYTSQMDIAQKGAIVAVSVAEFNLAPKGSTVYRLSAVVSSIDNAEQGNFHIKDYSGETYVYKLGGFGNTGVKVGDIVTLTGKRDEYKGTIELVSAVLEAVTPVTSVSIEEFLTKEDSKDVFYMVTGQITEIANADYGNIYISDGTNNLYVYGCYPGYGATGDNRKGLIATQGIEVGDEITVIGYKDTYKGTVQMANGVYFSHSKK